MNETRRSLSGKTGATKMQVQIIGPEEHSDKPSRVRLVAQHAESIRRLHKRSLADVMEIGRLLSECRKLLGHGAWLPWLRREFAWSERTARNYIGAFEALAGKSANVADLPIDVSSVYLITARSTPPEACAAVIARATAGEVLSRGEVKRIIHEAKQHQPRVRQAQPKISLNEVLERTGLIVLRKLSNVERDLHLDLAQREGMKIALKWAEFRSNLKKTHRDLLLGLDFLQTAAKPPMRKMIEAIPREQCAETAERVRVASEFLAKLCSKLMQK